MFLLTNNTDEGIRKSKYEIYELLANEKWYWTYEKNLGYPIFLGKSQVQSRF